MKKTPMKPERKSTRLQGYDYSLPGAYFTTIVTYKRQHLFGNVTDGQFYINQFGRIVEHCWLDLPLHYHRVELGAYVIMPNHFHGIVVIQEGVDNFSKGGSQTRPYTSEEIALQYGLPEIVRAFKSFSARKINNLRKTTGVPVWQRSFYDRIIRNERELQKISEYIQSNPQNWQEDEYINYR
jgi:putative transposase